MEVRLVNRVEDGPKCFLHDAVSQGGDAQRALLAIVLGYVDSPDGLRLVRFALQLVDEGRHLALVVRLERIPRLAIHAVGLAARSRQYPFSRYVHPVVPVQQVVQVGEPVFWMLTGRLCQEPLLFCHLRRVHTSLLRLSLLVLLHSSNCPPSPCGRLSRPRTTTRALPHVRHWPQAGLLRFWLLVDLQVLVCHHAFMAAFRRWATRYRRALTSGVGAGIPVGLVSGYLTVHVSFLYALGGSIAVALALGCVYGYLFRLGSRE